MSHHTTSGKSTGLIWFRIKSPWKELRADLTDVELIQLILLFAFALEAEARRKNSSVTAPFQQAAGAKLNAAVAKGAFKKSIGTDGEMLKCTPLRLLKPEDFGTKTQDFYPLWARLYKSFIPEYSQALTGSGVV